MPFERAQKHARTPQAATFRIGLPAAWLAIAVVWSLTPLSWLYTIWYLITLSPSLKQARPRSSTFLNIVETVILIFSLLECIFSIIYRIMAYKANQLRTPNQYSRQHLRRVLKRALEAGLTIDEAEQELSHSNRDFKTELQSLKVSEKLMRKLSAKSKKSKSSFENGYELRSRTSQWNGDGATTPELGKELQLPSGPVTPTQDSFTRSSEPASRAPSVAHGRDRIRGDDEGYGASLQSTDSLSNQRTTNTPNQGAKPYVPSFVDHDLTKDDPRAIDFRSWLNHWFVGAKDFEDVQRDNIAEWLAWSLYGVHLEDLEKERKVWLDQGKPKSVDVNGEPDLDEDGLEIEQDKLGLVEHCIEMIEARAATRFKPGRNMNIKTIRLTLDPVRVTQRPLLLYIFVYLMQRLVTFNMRARGFVEIFDDDTRYLIRVPQGWKPDRNCLEQHRPFMFVHGLGMGVVQYASMLSYLAKAKTLQDRPIVILIQPHISMSIFTKYHRLPPSEKTLCQGVERMAKCWGFDKSGMTILSHSNGTIVHAWILRTLPQLVTRSAFCDPVAFALWEPWVCSNFLYKQPKREPMEYIMRYFVARELGVALLLQRYFDWSSNLLWPSEIPNVYSPWHTAVFLSSEDAILNAERIRRYLRSHGLKQVKRGENVGPGRGGLKVHQGKKHGESMIGASSLAFNQIMAWVSSESDESGLGDGDTSSNESHLGH
ncbi:hypothetical protein OIO90_005960 [Microbotryomycetes sp. JL221]|nr:hypothetical protein OIO90_005960 [Microbotryomycetes sp. JL221]